MEEVTLLNAYGVYRGLDIKPFLPDLEKIHDEKELDKLFTEFRKGVSRGLNAVELYQFAITRFGLKIAREFMRREYGYSEYHMADFEAHLPKLSRKDLIPLIILNAEKYQVQRDAQAIGKSVEENDSLEARQILIEKYGLSDEMIENILKVKGQKFNQSSRSRIEAEVEIRKHLAKERFIKPKKGVKWFLSFFFGGSPHPLASYQEAAPVESESCILREIDEKGVIEFENCARKEAEHVALTEHVKIGVPGKSEAPVSAELASGRRITIQPSSNTGLIFSSSSDASLKGDIILD